MRTLTASVAFVLCLLLLPVRAGADWPQFRGPWGNGHAAAPGDTKPRGLPLRWSETENVTWKTAIPHRGWSSPVVLNGQVWLTTATTDGHDYFAVGVDAATGKIVFNERLFHAEKPEPLGNGVNGYGSPTPALEPGRAYIHFGSYGTACLDTATFKVLWERTDLACRHYRGPGSSVILFGNLLILSFDGVDVQYLAALDKTTGRTVWKTDRPTQWDDLDATGKPKNEGDLRKSFTTPLAFEAGGAWQMVSPGSKACYSYDPRTGKELWHVRHTAHTSVLRPLFSHGLAIFCTGLGKPELWAVRPDGRGDVTATHVAWKATQGVSRTPSPIVVGDLLYMVDDVGLVTCLEVATGTPVWAERIGGNYAASPIHADGRLYFCSQQGKTTVLKPGRAFEALAVNELESGCMASPAVSGGTLFLRTKTHLYRIDAATPGTR